MAQRIKRILTYWQNNLDKMPNKLLISLQNPVDYSPYYSILFRDKYRIILDLILSTMKYFPSFLIYSATFQYDKSLVHGSNSRYFIHEFNLLNKSNQIVLDLNATHERTVLPNEFLGDLHLYTHEFEKYGGEQEILNNGKLVSY